MPWFVLIAYMLTIPLSNWMIGHVGTTCIPGGPCVIPVWPGIYAPSGLAVAALALVLRDFVQLFLGLRASLGAVLMGAALSLMLAPAWLALASAAAFVVSETLDALVYTPLQKRGLVLAVVASGLVGIVVDSVFFLWLAFGSMDHLVGQIIGKGWTILIAGAIIFSARKRIVQWQ